MSRDHELLRRAAEQKFDLRAWLEQRCTLDAETGCLIWKGYQGDDGTLRGTMLGLTGLSLHRSVWQLSNPGPALGRRRAYAACGNPLCLAPAHQKARTISEAHKAASKAGVYSCPLAKGRRREAARKRRTPGHEEIKATIQKMRAEGKTYREIAQAVGMEWRDVGRVVRGEKWTDPSPAANASVFSWRPAA